MLGQQQHRKTTHTKRVRVCVRERESEGKTNQTKKVKTNSYTSNEHIEEFNWPLEMNSIDLLYLVSPFGISDIKKLNHKSSPLAFSELTTLNHMHVGHKSPAPSSISAFGHRARREIRARHQPNRLRMRVSETEAQGKHNGHA